MGLLCSCFSVIDYMFTTGGLKRWYFLSYFIHPSLIILCELYVAGSILLRSLISISILPYILLRRGIYQLVVIMGLDDASIIELYGFVVVEDEEEFRERWRFDADDLEDPYTSVTLHGSHRTFFPSSTVFGLELPFAREFRLREEKQKGSLAEAIGFHVQEEDYMYDDQEEEEDGLATRSGKEGLRGEEEIEGCKNEMGMEEEGEEKNRSVRRSGMVELREEEKIEGGKNEMEMEEEDEDRLVRSGKEELRGEEEIEGCKSEMMMEEEEEDRLAKRSRKELRGEEKIEECKNEMEIEKEEEEEDILVRRSGKEELGGEEIEGCMEETELKEELHINGTHERQRSLVEEEDDEFYQEYVKLMRNLDLHLKEKLTVMSVFLGVKIQELLRDANIYMRDFDRKVRKDCVDLAKGMEMGIEMVYVGQSCHSWGVDLAKGMEMDIEMVYVGQSCHTWEALGRYHMKFRELAAEGRRGVSWYHEAAERFKQFYVRLNWFLENEMHGEKRFWKYGRSRFDSKNLLLQVPQVSGYAAAEEKNSKGSESITAEQVVAIIEKCIQSFSNFLDADNAKSLKSNMQLGDLDLPVEDINDVDLLYSLIHEVRKKKKGLENLMKGKKRWWNRRTFSLDNSQKREALFSMVDVKLVSRVLKMSWIPNQHLKWCEQKLSNIHISERNIKRMGTVSFLPLV